VHDRKEQSHLFPQPIKRMTHLPLSLVKDLFYCDELLLGHYYEGTHIELKVIKRNRKKKCEKEIKTKKGVKTGSKFPILRLKHIKIQNYIPI
jgi:hypothetical protein